jgi:hypothetical protein
MHATSSWLDTYRLARKAECMTMPCDRCGADESPLWEGAYSVRAALPLWLLVAVAIMLVMGATGAALGWEHGLFLSLLTAAIGLGGIGLYVMFRRLTAHYTLTSTRLTSQTGFFVMLCEELNVLDIDDVALSQNRWERLAGVGTIKVMPVDGNRAELYLYGIRSAEHVAGLIEEAGRSERRRLGLFIE